MPESRTRVIAEIALVLALAKALDLIKLFELPQGGAVSLAMLPLFVLALYRGPLIGVAAGTLYGVVDLWPQPWVVYWTQFLLDYPVAYAAVGLTGAFSAAWLRAVSAADRTRIPGSSTASRQQAAALPASRWRPWAIATVAMLTGSALRFAVHVLSGVIFFGEFAPEGQPILVYSLLYNSFVFVAAGLCIVASWAVLPALRPFYRARGLGS